MIGGFDLDAWARERLGVRNERGGRGYDSGVRIVDCPLCDDQQLHRARGWVNVERRTTGCHNAGCPASREGGGLRLLEYVQAVEGLPTPTSALAYLRREFPAFDAPLPAPPPVAWEDWCRFPRGSKPFARPGGMFQQEAERFVARQWGLGLDGAVARGLRYCTTGWYAFRVVLPIVMGGIAVGFQARSYRCGEPKYLGSHHGAQDDSRAECGRPLDAALYGWDELEEGCHAVVVEGAGDVLGWEARQPDCSVKGDAGVLRLRVPVATLGAKCSDAQAALLAQKRPARVTVAFDAEPEAQVVARRVARTLRDWGLDAVAGTWEGGKDAGSGARLIAVPEPRLRRAG